MSLIDDRELDREHGAAFRAVLDPDAAVVLVDDAVGDGETEAGALSRLLCREERVEYAALDLGRDARAVVGDRDADGAAATVREGVRRREGQNSEHAAAVGVGHR